MEINKPKLKWKGKYAYKHKLKEIRNYTKLKKILLSKQKGLSHTTSGTIVNNLNIFNNTALEYIKEKSSQERKK